MVRTKGFLLLLYILLLTLTGSASASLGLYVGDEPVSLESPLMVVNGSILVPLTMMSDNLSAQTEWKPEKEQAIIEFPTKTISMQAGDINVLVNGENITIDVAPEISEGQLMIPLRFIADQLGIRMEFDNELMALVLESPKAFDLETELVKQESIETKKDQLKDISYLGGSRSRVFIDVTDYTGYQSTLLVNPDRLVIDLHGVKGEALPVLEVDDPIIQKIRSSRFDRNTMRVVFDLNRSTGYEISRWPRGGMEVEFNYQIGEIDFVKEDDIKKLVFDASAQPAYSTIYLTNPERLVLDLQNSTLLDGAKEYSVDDEIVRLVRVSQFTPSITRIVLELNSTLTPLTLEEFDERYMFELFSGTPEEAQRFTAEVIQAKQEKIKVEQKPKEEEPITADFELDNKILKGKIITIDPGHGGSDPGAIGPKGTFEKDVVLDISLILKELLEQKGAKIFLTRHDDTYVSVFERPKIAHEVHSDIFVSIHANSYINQIARGTETLYNPQDLSNFYLAQALQKELVKELQLIDRGLRPRSDLAVLNGARMPTALVEVAFLNHPKEEILLRTEGFQNAAARAIYNGIIRFFTQVGIRD